MRTTGGTDGYTKAGDKTFRPNQTEVTLICGHYASLYEHSDSLVIQCIGMLKRKKYTMNMYNIHSGTNLNLQPIYSTENDLFVSITFN